MPLHVGDLVELTVDKPASGGRMIGRHEGQIVLVAGAIPGERIAARVTRADKQLAFADVTAVLDASADRREPGSDPACGGCLYAHIAYARQVRLKADLIRDAFSRIGHIPIEDDITIAAGADVAYRMRARFHVRNGRAWFYRENTHETCDPRQTRQLSDAAVDAVDTAIRALSTTGVSALSVELSESVTADQRALHVEAAASADLDKGIAAAVAEARLTGATTAAANGTTAAAGDPIVTDPLSALSDGRIQTGVLRRHPQAFFQSNRFLISSLVGAVMDAVPAGPVLDLYAGVGLFSVALSANGHQEVTAVEGNPVSAADLECNATPYQPDLRVVRDSVEAYVQRPVARTAQTLILDPPRTGMSRTASQSVARSRVPRIVYVSCDPPTMARDARHLLDAGYRLTGLRGFDLFPNTAHVETLGVFDLQR